MSQEVSTPSSSVPCRRSSFGSVAGRQPHQFASRAFKASKASRASTSPADFRSGMKERCKTASRTLADLLFAAGRCAEAPRKEPFARACAIDVCDRVEKAEHRHRSDDLNFRANGYLVVNHWI
jgi:hypothetical protein